MTNREKFIQGKFTEVEQDYYLKQLFQTSYDQQLQKVWTEGLAVKGIYRKRLKKTVSPFGIAAILLFLIISLVGFIKFGSGLENRAQQYAKNHLDKNVYTNPNITKGAATKVSSKLIAADFFNKGQWEQASTAYGTIVGVNTQDHESRFYLAMSLLYASEYKEALTQFELLNSSKGYNVEEVRWFYGLSSLLAGDRNEAKEILQQITYGQWRYSEAQELLLKLK